MTFVFILLGLLIVVSVVLGIYISRSIFITGRRWSYEGALEQEISFGGFTMEFYQKLDMEEVDIMSDGLKLHAHYIDNNSEKTVILMHGYTYNFHGSIKYIKPYLKHKFNILMPDQRYYGKSEGKNPTLGYKERNDLHNWIDYILKRNPNNKVLGLQGESMGAVTSLFEGHNEAVDFLAVDCPFSTLQLQVEEQLQKRKIPKFFVYPASWLGSLLYGAPILPVNPVNNIKNIKAPIFLSHGDEDSYVSTKHFERNKAQLKPTDKTYLAQGANHAQSYLVDADKYDQLIEEFLKENKII